MADEKERPVITVAGTEIEDELYENLASAIVEQSILVPDMVSLVFYDPDFEFFEKETFKIGSDLKVSFSKDDRPVRVTTAQITGIAVEPIASGLHQLSISALGNAHRLANGAKLRTFEQLTDADIVSKIAEENGLTSETDATPAIHPWMIQDQDDYTFISDRARALGFEWWVTDTTLYFKKAANDGKGPALEWPDSLFSFKVDFSAIEAVKEITVRGWDPATQKTFEAKSSIANGTNELGADSPAAKDVSEAMEPIARSSFLGLSPVIDHDDAQSFANSIAQRGAASQVEARGVASGSPHMKAGTEVSIKGLGKELSGAYLLTSVDHVYRSGQRYVTRFRAGGREPAGLADLLGASEGNPVRSLGGQLVAGVVTDTTDPDKAGRVRVNFPTLGEDAPSYWARMCAPGAGKNRGLLVYPELGDEVLVGFEYTDPRRPVILGGLWSKELTPPEIAEEAIKKDKVETKGMFSRLGHAFVMSDGTSDDTKSVSIALSDKKTSFRLGEDTVTLDTPKPLTITVGDEITIKADSKGVTISGSTISIKSAGDLSLEGTNVSIKGSAGVTIDGAKTDVKASGMLNVEAGGVASVKGSLLKLN